MKFKLHLWWLGIVNRFDNLQRRIAWLLPHGIVRWCFFRVIAHATSGRWGSTNVPDLTWNVAADRWEEATSE